jgi:hypothetical protein
MGVGVKVVTSEIFDNTCDWKGMGRKQEKLIVGKPVEQIMGLSVEFSTIVTLVDLYCSKFVQDFYFKINVFMKNVPAHSTEKQLKIPLLGNE